MECMAYEEVALEQLGYLLLHFSERLCCKQKPVIVRVLPNALKLCRYR